MEDTMLTKILIIAPLLISVTCYQKEYSKGRKIGNIPGSATGLASGIANPSYLYTIDSDKLVILDKYSSDVITSQKILNGDGLVWQSLTVGQCKIKDYESSCVYVASVTASEISIVRFEEPDEVNLGTSFDGFQSLTVKSSDLKSSKIHIILDAMTNLHILATGGSLSAVQAFMVDEDIWDIGEISVETFDEVKLQQELDIASLSWNLEGDLLVVTSDGIPYVFLGDGIDIGQLLKSKPMKMNDLRIGKHHKLIALTQDDATGRLYALAKGKHYSIFKLALALSDDTYVQYDYVSGSSGNAKTGDCSDKNNYCERWKKDGMCDKRREYMILNCPAACGVCQENKRRKHLPRCVDGNHFCSSWAKQGLCKGASREYMLQNCKKSCDSCPGSESGPTCQDLQRFCASWASIGRCESRSDYMMRNCPASCKKCPNKGGLQNDQQPGVSTSNAACKDLSEYCESWAKNGKCDDRKDFMFVNCPQSCKLCGSSVNVGGAGSELKEAPKCIDSSKWCMVWAANKMCTIKKAYMSMHCKAACGFCQPKRLEDFDRSVCKDRHVNCKTWSKYRLCELKKDYMKLNCPESCGQCQGEEDPQENRIIVDRVTESTSSSGTEESASCRDNSEYCSIWASNDFCKTKPEYMISNCKKSCGKCNQEQGRKPTGKEQTVSKVASGDCKDDMESCKAWSEAGYCEKRPDVMSKRCRLSCNACTSAKIEKTDVDQDDDDSCKDNSERCKMWKTEGRCESSDSIRKYYCPKSCGECAGVSAKTHDNDQSSKVKEEKVDQRHGSSGDCEDKNELCSRWAKDNGCQKYYSYMQSNCPRSCNHCDSGASQSTSDCKDENNYCSVWSEKGYCEKRKNFMGRVCKLSCNLC